MWYHNHTSMHTKTIHIRTHVLLPGELVKEIDSLVGSRRRSSFFVDAAQEKVKRMKLKKIALKAVGSLANIPTPGWETSKKAALWVHDSRRLGEKKVK